eukprot:TRINITY_DN11676_c0_g1_i1.p1 TRINITY_DN11676_c0_g1~~TRINITY_DN11676_c0_g1_i1.p1  ORF type:complete len:189 (-),score=39.55 TRINITY_DN11676_c0_g1_i1:52-618(-)
MTVSLHKHGPGFFPGTGSIEDKGKGKGEGYSVNVPLHDGMDGKTYVPLFKSILSEVFHSFKPQAAVIQCGADCLAYDPLGTFNLTPKDMGECVSFVRSWNLPTVILGGGGYHNANTARCWAFLTSLIADVSLNENIPEHSYFDKYGPSFQLSLSTSGKPNLNSEEHCKNIIDQITQNLIACNTSETIE